MLNILSDFQVAESLNPAALFSPVTIEFSLLAQRISSLFVFKFAILLAFDNLVLRQARDGPCVYGATTMEASKTWRGSRGAEVKLSHPISLPQQYGDTAIFCADQGRTQNHPRQGLKLMYLPIIAFILFNNLYSFIKSISFEFYPIFTPISRNITKSPCCRV